MGTVGEALRLRELVDLAYDGLAKLLQGERDDAAAKGPRPRRADGASSAMARTRLPGLPASLRTLDRPRSRAPVKGDTAGSERDQRGNFGETLASRIDQESQGLDLVDEILEL